ncbi:MAG: hypothetical protein GY754_11610 [bacterium]|nr:hypothetical protein [bacterium]
MNQAANHKTVDLDIAEQETLELVLKEIILNLPHDPDSPEEVYRTDIRENPDHFRLCLYGYEMRALRKLLGKLLH